MHTFVPENFVVGSDRLSRSGIYLAAHIAMTGRDDRPESMSVNAHVEATRELRDRGINPRDWKVGVKVSAAELALGVKPASLLLFLRCAGTPTTSDMCTWAGCGRAALRPHLAVLIEAGLIDAPSRQRVVRMDREPALA